MYYTVAQCKYFWKFLDYYITESYEFIKYQQSLNQFFFIVIDGLLHIFHINLYFEVVIPLHFFSFSFVFLIYF